MASRDDMINRLVKAGLVPTVATTIVDDSERDGHGLLTYEEMVAYPMTNGAAIAESRVWFWYSPDVPAFIKRLPEAREI